MTNSVFGKVKKTRIIFWLITLGEMQGVAIKKQKKIDLVKALEKIHSDDFPSETEIFFSFSN